MSRASGSLDRLDFDGGPKALLKPGRERAVPTFDLGQVDLAHSCTPGDRLLCQTTGDPDQS
jgi:hypothetical protein